MIRTSLAPLLALGCSLGCGGLAVVERDQGGGAGGAGAASSVVSTAVSTAVATTGVTSSATSVSATSSSSTGVSCADLHASLNAAVDAATICNACSHFDGCALLAIVTDACGCDRQANGSLPDEVAVAQQAYEAWVATGCGPLDCGQPCEITGPTGFCQTDGSGCDGRCVGAVPPP